MGGYLARRLLFLIPATFFITVVIFLLVRFVPGDVVDLMVAEMGGEASKIDTAVTADVIKSQLGLDVPVHIQYIRWIRNLLRLDFGQSLWTGDDIFDELRRQLPVSIELGGLAIVLSLLFAIPVAVYSAVRPDTWSDYVGRSIGIAAISIPALWLGTMAVVYPSIWWNWTPQLEYIPFSKDIGGNLAQFLLPAAIIGMGLSGVTMRMMRTMILEVMRLDYVRTAWSKGLKETTVVRRHVLKNAFIPVLTTVGNQLPIIIGGSAIMEQIFGLPGIGRYLLTALNKRDYPIISAVTLVMAGFILVVNIIIDILYVYLDPRIKYD
ncbi:MAG: ABC transporter permease [Clostridiales bacterium]|jgi:peptide/nickel transport system permease protein|nr:ABC transporter permease [Clostridiales bacterium]